MSAQIVQPKRAGLRNQQAQDPMAGRQRPDPVGQFLVDADRNEVAERPVIADDALSDITGVQEPAGGLHHALQHGIQAEVLGDGDHCFQQPGHPFLGLEEFLGPGNETPEDTVNHGLRLRGGLVRALPH